MLREAWCRVCVWIRSRIYLVCPEEDMNCLVITCISQLFFWMKVSCCVMNCTLSELLDPPFFCTMKIFGLDLGCWLFSSVKMRWGGGEGLHQLGHSGATNLGCKFYIFKKLSPILFWDLLMAESWIQVKSVNLGFSGSVQTYLFFFSLELLSFGFSLTLVAALGHLFLSVLAPAEMTPASFLSLPRGHSYSVSPLSWEASLACQLLRSHSEVPFLMLIFFFIGWVAHSMLQTLFVE